MIDKIRPKQPSYSQPIQPSGDLSAKNEKLRAFASKHFDLPNNKGKQSKVNKKVLDRHVVKQMQNGNLPFLPKLSAASGLADAAEGGDT